MPNEADFAELYKRLIDRNIEPDPQRLAQTRGILLAQLSARDPPQQERPLWTQADSCDTIDSDTQTGEELQ